MVAVLANLTLIFALCFQEGKPDEAKPVDKKPAGPILKAKLAELDKLFKASYKEVASKKTTAEKQDVAEKYVDLLDEWCAKQESEKWDFEVVIDDILKSDDEYFAKVGPPSLLAPFRDSSKTLWTTGSVQLILTDEQRTTFTIGTKLKVTASVRISDRGAKNAFGGLFGAGGGIVGDDNSKFPILFYLHQNGSAFSAEPNRIRVEDKHYECRLEEVELEAIGEVKPEKPAKKRK